MTFARMTIARAAFARAAFARPVAALAALVAAAFAVAPPALANGEDPLEPYLWKARPVVIFADAAADPRLVRQLDELARAKAEMEERDVVVIVDAEPPARRAEASALRARFRPHGFNVLVLGKDGEVKLRRPNVITAAQLSRLIDRMPMRQQELGRR